MRDWFLKNLGDAMLACEQQDRIRELLLSAYAQAGDPDEMAAFIRHESEGRLHCEVKIYFSPLSATVAREVDARPCEKPSPAGLSLLAGSRESWTALFPERNCSN
ncbi:MAG: hypothetical protein GY815_10820 [Gammaproteobacteria bacterium]|nr:hypothetical protein [Gammaproteobacteria bacterium]